MFRNLVAKVLKSLLKKVEIKKEVVSIEQYCTVSSNKEVSKPVKVHETHENKTINLDRIPNNSEERRLFINDCLESISAELYVKGYKELNNILSQYHIEVIQSYVLSQLVNLGQYDPEHDNLDSFTREQLIDKAIENNQLQFRQRMIEQGKANVSEKQMKMITDLSSKLKVQVVMPKDKFEASEMIETLQKRLGVDTNSKTPSEAQIRAISNLCKKLGKNLAIMEVAVDIQSASSLIQDLQNELKAHPELDIQVPASKEQIEYVKRLLTLLNKRWTAKREQQYTDMSSKDISAVITTLKDECEKQGLIDHKASKGQVDYILSLGKLLKKNYNPEEIKALDKDKASKVIESLQRAYLLFLYKGNGSKITKEEIAKMNLVTVRQLIEQLSLERKTNLYEKTANDYSGAQQCL